VSETVNDEILSQSQQQELQSVEMFKCFDNINFFEDQFLAKKRKVPDGVMLPFKFKKSTDLLFAEILEQVNEYNRQCLNN
jgi:hypothetical protein